MPDRPRRQPPLPGPSSQGGQRSETAPATSQPDREASADGLVVVGRVLSPWGLRGEMKVQVLSSNPARFAKGATLLLKGEPRRVLASRRGQKGQVILLLEGISTPEDVGAYRQAVLLVPVEEAPALDADWYYH